MLRWLALFLLIPAAAAADPPKERPEPFELGAFFGPRFFSQIGTLGYIDDAPGHPMLNTAVAFGARASHAFMFPWLVPEFELELAPTSTHTIMVNGANVDSVNVLWLEPRFAIRIDPPVTGRLHPFALGGFGTPISLSSARKTFNSGIVGDGFVGGGVRFDTGKGFIMRFDARLAFVPGVQLSTGDNKLGYEGDVSLGVEVVLGAPRAAPGEKIAVPSATSDKDGDGSPDNVDKCPDRPEDKDGFEDADGCPDIDDDGDGVLDIADKCPKEKETRNGFEDEDGCPDQIPAEIDKIKGTIEGLIYAEGETVVRDSAQPHIKKIAAVMQAHPSIKIVLVGYTDNQEAKAFATPEQGKPPPDIDSLATDLSHARAEAVKEALLAQGIAAQRIIVEGAGAEDPVADNATQRGRLANRRVQLKLFVAQP